MNRTRDCLPVTDDGGLWRQLLVAGSRAAPRPALFLDRDGVVVEEIGYLHRIADVQICPGIATIIADCNVGGIPVVVVTNQSGIGRGYYDWADFAAVQRYIVRRLNALRARFDMVMACGFHEQARPPFDIPDHPWRKPNPGMLQNAADALNIDLARSWIIGDRATDLDAGFAAGLAGGYLVDSERREFERRTACFGGTVFDARFVDSVADCAPVVAELIGARGTR